MGIFWILVKKDIVAEVRRPAFLVSSLVFGVLLELVIGIALNTGEGMSPTWRAGVLWMGIFFATGISMGRNDDKEREFDGRTGVLLAPVDRSAIFYAKWLSTCVFVLVAESALVGAFLVFLNQPWPTRGWAFVGVLLLGTVGLTGAGSFLSALTAASSLREVLFPLLLFPICVPLFLGVTRLTLGTMTNVLGDETVWWEVLGGYAVGFAVFPWLVYEWLVEV